MDSQNQIIHKCFWSLQETPWSVMSAILQLADMTFVVTLSMMSTCKRSVRLTKQHNIYKFNNVQQSSGHDKEGYSARLNNTKKSKHWLKYHITWLIKCREKQLLCIWHGIKNTETFNLWSMLIFIQITT